MKKSVKILMAAVFAVGFGSLANAQSATISANATVISEIAVARVGDLNFGTLVAGQSKAIDYNGTVSVSTGTSIGTTRMGEFTVAAQAGSDVKLSFTLPSNLTGSGSTILPISFSWDELGMYGPEPTNACRIVIQEGGGAMFVDPTLGPISLIGNSFPTYEAIPGTNSVRVFIGGKVDATGVTAGSYTGNITLSATYN